MNRKLPNIYKNDEKIKSSNKRTYYSFRDSKEIIENEKSTEEVNFNNNFFQYFNKDVEIELTDGTIINARILSKSQNRIMLNDGSHIDVSKIRNIK